MASIHWHQAQIDRLTQSPVVIQFNNYTGGYSYAHNKPLSEQPNQEGPLVEEYSTGPSNWRPWSGYTSSQIGQVQLD